jgi:hypothetical protein
MRCDCLDERPLERTRRMLRRAGRLVAEAVRLERVLFDLLSFMPPRADLLREEELFILRLAFLRGMGFLLVGVNG